tara:strand:+ start:779 stop:928 length:150 start_codon:yes stop_codon:yes gene_type:complete
MQKMCGKLIHEIKTKKIEIFPSIEASGFKKKNKNNANAPKLKGSAFLNK